MPTVLRCLVPAMGSERKFRKSLHCINVRKPVYIRALVPPVGVHTMLITMKSMYTGMRHTREIPVTQAQIDARDGGELIQDCMSNLTPDEREFLMTGITPEEWAAIMRDQPETVNAK